MVGVGAVSGGTGGAGPTDATMRAAASKFEAMAIGELLKPIFDTVDNSAGPFGGGAAERQWMPMLVDAIAERMVRPAVLASPPRCSRRCNACNSNTAHNNDRMGDCRAASARRS